ncbi:MAG: hypothetical protein R3C44_19590 [Chloroflexota bacterium]
MGSRPVCGEGQDWRGKERMFSLGQDDDFRAVYDVPDSEDDWWETVAGWHKRKSAIYKDLIASGALPGRTV